MNTGIDTNKVILNYSCNELTGKGLVSWRVFDDAYNEYSNYAIIQLSYLEDPQRSSDIVMGLLESIDEVARENVNLTELVMPRVSEILDLFGKRLH